MNYQRINAKSKAPIGDPASLPEIFVGLSDDDLADLASINPTPAGYEGQGFVPVADVAATPAAFYLSKTLFEDRMTDAQFVAFDTLRLAVRDRPQDWATSAAFADRAGFVRPLSRYESADRVNLEDTGLLATLAGFAHVHPEVFGDNPQAEIARLLKPELTDAERAAAG